MKEAELRPLIAQLISDGYIIQTQDEYSVLKMGDITPLKQEDVYKRQGIQLTYGMSIDYLGYKGIEKQYTQRGGTLITRKKDGSVSVKMVPLTSVVSTKVSGVK